MHRSAAPVSRRRLGALALVAVLVLTGLVSTACDGTDPTKGKDITREEVLNRARIWFYAEVPYSQTSYFPNEQDGYRQDCSGFVSMAWNLPISLTTSTLTFVTDRLPSTDDLQPGDILLRPGHVYLFRGWDTLDQGRHRYARLWAMANSNAGMQFYPNTDLTQTWLQGYVPYRYRNIR